MKLWRLSVACLLLLVLLTQPVFAADPADSLTTLDSPSMNEPLSPSPGLTVLASFRPNSVNHAWGIAYDDSSSTVWVTDAYSSLIRSFDPQGNPLGSWPVGAPGTTNWSADQEYDVGRGLVYLLWVGGDNAIHTWYPAKGKLGPVIDDPDGVWTAISQRGIAHDPKTDTLYVGSWNTGILYRLQGLSWDNPGKVISSWNLGWDISGLAWLNDGTLAVVNNSNVDNIYIVDPTSMAILDTYLMPGDSPGYAGAGIDAEAAGPAWLVNQLDQTAYRVDLGRPYSKVTLLEPNKNAVLPAGTSYTIRWGAPVGIAKYQLAYSLDNGLTWSIISKKLTGSSFEWTVPSPAGNKNKCRIKVTGYDSSGRVKGVSISKHFAIEVLRVTAPNGGEEIAADVMTTTVTWSTNATKRPVAKTKVKYTRNGGQTWLPLAILDGNPGTCEWRVPTPIVDKTKCKVKVVLKDVNGVIIGMDKSDSWFTIKGRPTG